MAKTTMNPLLTLVLGSLMVFGGASAIAQSRVGHEQRHFSAEDETVKNPVAIPLAVRALLAKEEMVRDAARFDHIAPEDFPASWFLTSAVSLGNEGEKDLVLVGRGPMSGANITQFWVFHATDEGYDLVLQAGAHDLFVNDRMQHGFREIELQSATGIRFYTVVFRFDGKRYKVIRNTSESTR
jgi:hypothetical protein